MRAHLRRPAALSLIATALALAPITGCEADDDSVLLPLPGKLRLDALTPERRALLRAELSIPGQLAPTELAFDEERAGLRGSFVLSVTEPVSVEATLRLLGRFADGSAEVLVGRARTTLQLAPRETARLVFADDEWVIDGSAVFDPNGNGAPSIDDLIAGFDPAPPAQVLDVSPGDLQFPSGLLPGDQARQVIVVENVSGLPQELSAEVIGGQGMSIVRVDATGEPDDGAPRRLPAIVLQPFQEQVLAVTFAPTNAFLARGTLALQTRQPDSNVRAIGEVGLFANSDGDPQPVLAGYDAGVLDGDVIGFDGDVLVYPPAQLFGGQPLAPGVIPLNDAGDVLRVPTLAYPASTVGDLAASTVFLVQIPARHRLAAEISGLQADVDLGVFLLDASGALSGLEGEALVSRTPGLSPEFVQFRNPSQTAARRAVIVVSRVDDREDATAAADDGIPYQLLAQLNAGPELADESPIAPTRSAFRGGTIVTIKGAAFEPGATVRFGRRIADPARTTVSEDGTTVTTTSPPAEATDVGARLPVVVTNPDGQAATHPPIFVFDPPAPAIDDVDPATASTLGGTPITITGAFFAPGARVVIGGTPATDVEVVSSSRIEAVAPPGIAGFTFIVVENLDADGVAVPSPSFPFVYLAPAGAAPTLTAVAPSSGPVGGGTALTLTGSGFIDGASVRIGGSAAAGVVVVNSSTITCFAPPAFAAGPASLTVTNPDGQSVATTYTYFQPAPEVLAVTPGAVSTLGGTRLSVDGAGFVAGATALFTQGAIGNPGVGLTFVSSTRLLVTAPAGLTAGPAQFTIVNADGQSSAPFALTVAAPTAPPPRIVSLTPPSLRIDALTDVTVTGSGFAAGLVVLVDDIVVTAADVTASTLRFTPPARAPGTAIVRVINPDGQSDADALVYADALEPFLGTITPDAVGALVPGDIVTVGGANLPILQGAARDAAFTIENGLGDVFSSTVLDMTSTSARLRIDEPLPDDDDYVVVFDRDGQRAVSPSFVALAPSVISQQVIAGQAVEGSAFTVLIQGANLIRDRIGSVRFSRDGVDVDLTPQLKTSSLVRVDVPAGTLGQGSYTVALRWPFVDEGGQGTALVLPAPDALVVRGQCGNGVVDVGEECDGANLDGLACDDVGFASGVLRCTDRCLLDTGACTRCGNGIIDDALEECDGDNLGGVVCQDGDPDFTSGSPVCTPTCVLSFSTCGICGNGLIDGQEDCDGSNLDSESCSSLGLGFGSGGLACRGDCRFDTIDCDRCGDNRCGDSEDRDCIPSFAGCTVCAADCVATCGDGTCDATESCQTCPRDCAATCNAPFSLTLTSGGNQSNRLAADLPAPLVVTARDDLGQPLIGVQITFTPPPGGHASPATTVTDLNGNASSLLTVPRVPGAHAFLASGTGPDGTILVGAPLSVPATATDLDPRVVQTLLNHAAVSGRTSLLDAGGTPIATAATKALVNLDGNGGSGVVLRESDGSLFISDTSNHRVLRLDADGALSLVAGSNVATPGFSGDNGPARSALLSSPRGLALNAAGELFIADTNNNRIRKVDATGRIATVVGGGTSLLEGAFATTAQLQGPTALLFDPDGDLVIQNTSGSQLIRRVDATSQTISTVVAAGTCGGGVTRVASTTHTQMARDRQGRLLFIGVVGNAGGCPIAPNVTHVLRLEADGTLSSVAGGPTVVELGQARGARLENPVGLAADPAGHIYISELGASGRRVRRVSPLGIIQTIVGTGVSGAGGDGGAAAAATFTEPAQLVMSAANDLYILDAGVHQLRVVRALGEVTPPSVVATTLGDGQSASITQPLAAPLGLRVLDDGGNPVPGAVVQFTAPPGAAAEPSSATTDAQGTATFVGFVGRAPGTYPFSISAIGADGLPLPGSPFTVTATATDVAPGTVIAIVNQDGAQGNTAAGGAAARTRVNLGAAFAGLAVDGVDGTLYLADSGNHRILRIAPSGLVTQIAGTGVAGRGGNGPALSIALSNPRGLALDGDRNLYIADTNNDVVRVLRTADRNCAGGCDLSIFAGNAINDPNPADGVVATGANLDNPIDLALRPDGTGLVIVDSSHNRIRLVAMDPAVPAVPGVISTLVAPSSCSSVTGPRFASFSGSGAGIDFDLSGRLYVAGNVGNSGGCPAPNPNEQYVARQEEDGSLSFIAGGDVERAAGVSLGTDIDEPAGVEIDEAGNLYIVERSSHRIRRVDRLGRMTTLVGDGVAGRVGDGGPVTGARLDNPTAIKFGPGGDLYIVDGSNHEVRLVRGIGTDVADSARIVLDSGDAQSIVIGQNTTVPLRVRVLDNANDSPVTGVPVIFLGANAGDSVFAPSTTTDVNGFASTTVRIGRSVGLQHDVAATAETWLERIPLNGGPVVFTIAGTLPPSRASSVVANSLGIGGRIPADGTGDSIASVEARMSLTGAGVAVDDDGTLFVADASNNRIVTISPEGVLSVFAGSGTSGFVDNVDRFTARFSSPSGIVVDSDGSVFVADTGNRRIRKIDPAGNVSTFAGGNSVDPAAHGDGNDPAVVNFNVPEQLLFGPDGALYVSDTGHDTIRRIVLSPFSISTVVTPENCSSATGPRIAAIFGGMAFDAAGRLVFAGQASNIGGCTFAVNTPLIVRSDAPLAGPPSQSFTLIAGNATTANNVDGLAANASRLTDLQGMALDPTSGDIFFVESSGSQRLRRIIGGQPTGTVETILGVLNSTGFSAFTAPGTGQLNGPTGLVLDQTRGQLYLTEDGSDVVRLMMP